MRGSCCEQLIEQGAMKRVGRAKLSQGLAVPCWDRGAGMLMRTPHRWVRPKRRRPPGFILPCQPMLADKVPVGDGWIHELKHDGFRIVALKDGDTVCLWSRNGRDWAAEFGAITVAMRALPFERLMIDGEAVAHCLEGLPDFHR